MWANNTISAGVGLVPIAGDMILAIYKANSRNAKLLEEYLRVLGEEHIAAGLPNLTPEPPALPGQVPHPAQPAARQLVKDHSQQQLGASGSGQPGTESTTASGMETPASTRQKSSGSTFWQRKKN